MGAAPTLAGRPQWRQTGFVSYGAGVATIGLFGGTFDPPHVGHLVTAVNVRHELGLDRMLLMVANAPWQKLGTRTITPAADRLAMVQAAVEGVDGLEASALELDRGGLSYTADTIAELRGSGSDEVFLVLGSDAAAGLDTWERVDEVQASARIVVVDRPGEGLDRTLPEGYSWVRVEVPRLEVSSTDLRERVIDGRPLDYLLPRDVIACIRARGLYQVRA